MNLNDIGHAHIIPDVNDTTYCTRLSTCVLQANYAIHTFSVRRDLIFLTKLKLGFFKLT